MYLCWSVNTVVYLVLFATVVLRLIENTAMWVKCAGTKFSSVACPALQHFLHYFTKARLSKNLTGHKMCVLMLSTSFRLKHFSFYEDMSEIWRNIYIGYSCYILTKIEFYLQIFEKYSNTKFHESLSIGNRVVPRGQTDMTKLIIAFRNFANASERETCGFETHSEVVCLLADRCNSCD